MIYLLRHGRTEFNAAGRYQGRVDSPLTEEGRAQAARVGRCLAEISGAETATILASPLGRAMDTARIVAEALGGLPVTPEPRLIEVSMGDWDGRTAEEIDSGWPGVRDSVARNMWFFAAPNGETYDDVARRVADLMADLARRDGVFILVSHAVSGRVLRGVFAGLPPERAVRQEIPQDAFFRLHDATVIERIDCD